MGEMERPMTDHYTEAARLISVLPPTLTDGGILALAQVHATLALAEQQRIANLIALLPGSEISETGGAVAQIYGSGNALDKEAIVKAAFESIDINELADVISGWLIGSGYYSIEISIDEAQNIAQAVKDWLTGKETS